MLAENELGAGTHPHDAFDRRLIDVRGRTLENDDARPSFGDFDAHVEIANVFTRDDEVVVEVSTNRHAACQRKPLARFVDQHEGIPRVGHSKQYCTLQSAAAAPKFSSPAPRIRSTSRRTKCARVSSACRTKLPFVL